jgi:uncharacterized protein (DUF488 family)
LTEPQLFTIGHSNHTLAHFMLLLRRHGVTAVADVRSQPRSRRQAQFNQDALAAALRGAAGIEYVFLGRQLGARPDDPECYVDGRVSYERLATCLSFRQGVRRLLTGLTKYRIALMCAERDPLECHRGILIAPQMSPHVPSILHIGPDGDLETHAEAEQRLLKEWRLTPGTLFDTERDCLAAAYRRQEERIAWRPDREESAE